MAERQAGLLSETLESSPERKDSGASERKDSDASSRTSSSDMSITNIE